MKKLLFIAVLTGLGFAGFGQANPPMRYPTTDSIRRDIDRFVRNSALVPFTNLRLNNILYGMTQHIDSTSGGQDSTVGIGVNITRINPAKVQFQHKEVMFDGTANLRAWNTDVTQNYIYKVAVSDTMTREFKYDPSDATTADNGVTVIVNGAGKRFKLETTVFYAKQFGAKGDWNGSTGTDNTAAFRKIFSLLNGSKNLSNVKIVLGGGRFRITDTLATPNSAGWFTLEGDQFFTTQIVWDGTAVGKDVLTLLNPQHTTIQDIEFANSGAHGKPSAMIRYHTNSAIIGTSGMIGDNVLRRVLMRGNVGVYDYGVRITCAPDHDQNLEQFIFDNCYIELADVCALSIETFNSLWNRVYGGRYSSWRVAINLSKPNPGGYMDSAAGSLALMGTTLMSLLATDTLVKCAGCQFAGFDLRSEGPGKTMLWARHTPDDSYPIIHFDKGTITMGTPTLANQRNINVDSSYVEFNGTTLNPTLMKVRAGGNVGYLRFINCIGSMDTLEYSQAVRIEGGTMGVPPAGRIKSNNGTLDIFPYKNAFREFNGTVSATPDVSGETMFGIEPSSPTTITNFLNKAPYQEFTLVTNNGNTTIANNSNIITLAGANMTLPANTVITFIKNSINFGATWLMKSINYLPAGLSTNRIPKWDGSKFVNSNMFDVAGVVTSDVAMQAPSFNATTSFNLSVVGASVGQIDNFASGASDYAGFRMRNNSGAAGEYQIRVTGTTYPTYPASTVIHFNSLSGGTQYRNYDGGAGEGPHSWWTGLTTKQVEIGASYLLNKASNYINWGTTTGTSGYGFRDNGGVMEWKNSGGSWATFSGGGGMTNPMTTQGDLIYGGASGTPTRLAAGTAGQLLQTNGASAPSYTSAPIVARVISSVGTTPSNTPGTAAGTGPTVVITGNDMAGEVSVTTGTSPASNATIVTVTFTSTYANAPVVVFCNGNSANVAAGVQVSGATNAFTLSITGSLTASTNYKWNYMVIGK